MSFMKFQCEGFTSYNLIECEVCTDCYGEDCEIDGLLYHPKTIDELGNEFNNRDEFSRSSCDCCGSTLGGERYTMVALDEGDKGETKFKWRLSAPGYMDCTDWSVADDIFEAIRDCLGMYGDSFDEDDFRDLGSYVTGFDDFLDGYVLGLCFTAQFEDGESSFGEPGCDIADCVDIDEIWERISEDERVTILADCIGFVSDCGELLEPLAMHDAGSDFHLTRNRHGAGFWDGDWGDIGDELTELARPYGTREMMVSLDGSIGFHS